MTDDVVLLRPLHGVLNLCYSLTAALGGLLTAPFDGGDRVQAGLHGAFYSLPELVFGNIRKGSFATVDAEIQP